MYIFNSGASQRCVLFMKRKTKMYSLGGAVRRTLGFLYGYMNIERRTEVDRN